MPGAVIARLTQPIAARRNSRNVYHIVLYSLIRAEMERTCRSDDCREQGEERPNSGHPQRTRFFPPKRRTKASSHGPSQARSNPEVEHNMAPVVAILDQDPAHLGAVQLQAELELCSASQSLTHNKLRKRRPYQCKIRSRWAAARSAGSSAGRSGPRSSRTASPSRPGS